MRIIILANSSSGVYGFRKELIDELIKENEIIVITPDSGQSKEIREMGCRVINISFDRRGINPIKDLGLILQYRELINEIVPDLVVTYTIKPNIYGGIVCRLLKIPYAINITGLGTAFQTENLLKNIVILMYRFALKNAKVVFFENSANRDVFLEANIINKEQACLLNGAGVNLQDYSVAEYPEDEVIKFLFMGRVMTEKGINELFEAMKILIKDGVKAELHVLGGYEEDYKNVIETYEQEGWLHYHGYQTDVRPYIHASHCFVLPSWHEGMANTNLECAASGRPVITSNIPGCKEAVVENISGFLCETKNVDSLYMAMKKFLDLSQEERINMGLAGRRHMEKVFDKKKVVLETVKRLFE